MICGDSVGALAFVYNAACIFAVAFHHMKHVAALAQLGVVVFETEGECLGEIAREPSGSNGFGYDPIFFLPELGRTYAQLIEEEKNRCSHRARAVAALLAGLHCHAEKRCLSPDFQLE